MSEDKLPARGLVELLKTKRLSLAVAESCTGGLLSDMITDVPGASDVFLGGAVVYSNEAKTRMLGIPSEVLDHYGPVSAKASAALAEFIALKTGADVCAGVTGNAGPTAQKGEVGEVFIALHPSGRVERFLFTGDRKDVKRLGALSALEMLYELVESL